MAVTIGNDGMKHLTLLTPGQQRWRWFGWLALAAITVFCWRIMTGDTIWAFVWDAPKQAEDIFERMLPPRWSYINQLWKAIWDTINIATLGTLIALVLATPLAFLAARNTTPGVMFVRPIALFIIVASRSIAPSTR
jgi:phosphonate transport system permease protein